VSVATRVVLERPNQPIEHVYFYETALGSTVARSGESPSDAIEVGVCGREGMSGVALVNQAGSSPFSTFIQIPGCAFRMSADDLRMLCDTQPEMNRMLLRFAHCHSVQVGYTAFANGRRSVLERMSRWILMCHDRVPNDSLELTHEFLSLMLGVRRAGITTDMHVLEGEHAVINKRGRIIVRERARLEEFAGDCYGDPEAEYLKLIGLPLRRTA
jgi:CRP-like cAMP-binding protein